MRILSKIIAWISTFFSSLFGKKDSTLEGLDHQIDQIEDAIEDIDDAIKDIDNSDLDDQELLNKVLGKND